MVDVIVGEGISKKCLEGLLKLGCNPVVLPAFELLKGSVASHVDMLTFYSGNRILTHKRYYDKNRHLFDGLGIKVDTTDENISELYPNDILFNAVLTKKGILFSKGEYTSAKIKSLATEVVNVKQGYTACSTCKVADNGFITSDAGLFKAYCAKGIDALLVEKEGIALPGYDCGFIGGASVVFNESVCFFGRIEDHPDYDRISDFIAKYGKTTVSLSDEKLTDIGGAVVVK